MEEQSRNDIGGFGVGHVYQDAQVRQSAATMVGVAAVTRNISRKVRRSPRLTLKERGA